MPRLPSLRRVRESRLLTQQELADLAGVHRVTIASLETTAGEARFSTVRKLAAALQVEPSELLRPPDGGGASEPTEPRANETNEEKGSS